MSDSVRPHRWQPTRLCHSWDSPGKNSGVVCHFLLQCMKVKSESEVAQSCPTLSDPMDCSLPGSSVHGIFQARVLESVATAFSVTEASTQFSEDPAVTLSVEVCPALLFSDLLLERWPGKRSHTHPKNYKIFASRNLKEVQSKFHNC